MMQLPMMEEHIKNDASNLKTLSVHSGGKTELQSVKKDEFSPFWVPSFKQFYLQRFIYLTKLN